MLRRDAEPSMRVAASSASSTCWRAAPRAWLPAPTTPLVDADQVPDDRQAVRAPLKTPRAAQRAGRRTGRRPLHWAVDATSSRWCGCCCAPARHAQAANRYGVTPLMLAATNGNAVILEALLEAGADAKRGDAGGRDRADDRRRAPATPKRCGCSLAHGADVNAQESWMGETALMWAAGENHAAAVNRARQEQGRPQRRSRSPRRFPARSAARRRCRAAGSTPLMYAARQGALDVGARAR